MYEPQAVTNLISELKKLPSIGQKTAERITFFLLKREKGAVEKFTRAVIELKETVSHCQTCNGITDKNPCNICADVRRDPSVICVVENPYDMFAIERAGDYKGRYYVLLGVISPLDGIGPEDLKINNLLEKISRNGVKEVILATNPTMQGEATALYISKLVKPMGLKVTRIARGIPIGSALEYTDQVTLQKSFEGRMEM